MRQEQDPASGAVTVHPRDDDTHPTAVGVGVEVWGRFREMDQSKNP